MIPKDKKAKEFAILACSLSPHFPTDGSAFPYIGTLKEDDTIKSILERLWKYGETIGYKKGKEEKMKEIQKVLGITEIDEE